MDRFWRTIAIAGVLLLSLISVAGQAQADQAKGSGVTDVMLAADPGESWLHTNGNWAAQRFSTLAQLNPSNVKNLKVA